MLGWGISDFLAAQSSRKVGYSFGVEGAYASIIAPLPLLFRAWF